MHACIRSSGGRGLRRLAQQRLERALQLTGDGPQRRLKLEAVKVRPVVLDDEPDRPHARAPLQPRHADAKRAIAASPGRKWRWRKAASRWARWAPSRPPLSKR